MEEDETDLAFFGQTNVHIPSVKRGVDSHTLFLSPKYFAFDSQKKLTSIVRTYVSIASARRFTSV